MDLTPQPFNPAKMHGIVVAERVGSALSIIGSFFIIITFLCLKGAKKSINRLIFLASFGNVLANIATMFSTAALQIGGDGRPSPACRAQGFMIQAFIPADALWAACMAWNVYATFFQRRTLRELKSFEMRYIAICYGLPLTVAAVCLVADARAQEPIYGPATIWCWITRDYDWMRMAFFYGPVLAIIAITFILYIIVFVKFVGRNARALNTVESTALPLYNLGISFANPALNEFSEIQAVTKIDVTSETTRAQSEETTLSSFASTSPLTANAADQPGAEDAQPTHHTVISGGQVLSPAQTAQRNARTYLLTAALVWVVLMAVWVPSTINRIQSIAKPERPDYGMNLSAAIVLPLQGLGNALIYGVTSRHEIHAFFLNLRKTQH